MAVGEFTKECAQEALDTLLDMGKRLTKPKLREFFGHFNEIALFIEAAKRHAPHASGSTETLGGSTAEREVPTGEALPA